MRIAAVSALEIAMASSLTFGSIRVPVTRLCPLSHRNFR